MDPEIIKRYFEEDTRKISENEALLNACRWRVIKISFPIIVISMVHPKSLKEYYFMFTYDDIPISLQAVNHDTFLPALFSEWPQGQYFLCEHSTTHKPFLCAPGIKEYHTHSSHSSEAFNYTTGEFRLPSVVDTVYNHLLNTNG